VFALALAIFTLASVFCGLSTTVDQFVAMRVLQDGRRTHGTCRPPGCITYHTKTPAYYRYSHADLARTGRPIIGPPLGGFITSYADWRWIFFINVPLGIAAIILALKIIPDLHEDARRPFDLPGFVANGGHGEPGVRDGIHGRATYAGRADAAAVSHRFRCSDLRPAPFPARAVADDPPRCDAGADLRVTMYGGRYFAHQ
jgi:MFS family permease